ncbi:MAG: acetyl-CoA carboxylase carboxyltransferase subunit alpha [Candidatus Marinimicrobia bacterium]|nr:acetyl-CoA carboxylase carboxyltransferase subunit alpha [Candidatus Neomarinimicrobiota bacterium]
MNNVVLEFEKPIVELENKLLELRSQNIAGSELAQEIEELEKKRQRTINKIFGNLTRWQRVQLARHPQRPYSLDYINYLSPDFLELHGDRFFADDPSIVCGIGTIEGKRVMYLGQQKGRNTNDNLHRNFGMMRPEGYRKALRVMKLAEKFNVPIISLIDTMGAFPGLGAEERGQGEAIARNLFEMSQITVPILIIVIGEGASGGALGIGVGDRFLMLENTWFSVISPEGCASILWRDAAKAPEAADAMKVTSADLLDMGICDRVINEPLGGAHRDHKGMCEILKNEILIELTELELLSTDDLLEHRFDRLSNIGNYSESK